ncbi:MAG: TetR/AcrR family transcriptional regulator [Pseudomonadota bacterium]
MDTRQNIINHVGELLQTHSYEGFSFQDVADAVGIRKASIYSHFKSKDEVVIETLNGWREMLASEFQEIDHLAAPEKLERYFQWYRKLHHGAQRMCPGGSFAAIWSAVSPQVKVAVEDLGNVQITWLAETITLGRQENLLQHNDHSAQAEAEYVFSALQGALLFSRLSNNARHFDNVTKHLCEQLMI